jgi:hypothetical protein
MSPAPTSANTTDDGTKALWVGAFTMLMLAVGTTITLTYVLVDIPWQLQFGDWNYLVGAALMIGSVIPLRMWHPYGGARVGMSAADDSTFDTSQVESPV